MKDFFIVVLNNSARSALLIIVVLLLRYLFKSKSKRLILLIWTLVALRLLFPYWGETSLGVLPQGNIFSEEVELTALDYSTDVISLDGKSESISFQNGIPFALVNVCLSLETINIITYVWLAGVLLMILYVLNKYIRISSRVKTSIILDKNDNVWCCDKISTSFVFGIIKPRILLSMLVEKKDFEFVLAHEKIHLQKCDHIKKIIAYFILSFYWFNPIVWLSFLLFTCDIEYRCDEMVIEKLGTDKKSQYAISLINEKIRTQSPLDFMPQFGGKGIKNRVKNIMRYSPTQTKHFLRYGFLVAILIVLLFLATKPDPFAEYMDSYGFEIVDYSLEQNNLKIVVKYPEQTWEDQYIVLSYKKMFLAALQDYHVSEIKTVDDIYLVFINEEKNRVVSDITVGEFNKTLWKEVDPGDLW